MNARRLNVIGSVVFLTLLAIVGLMLLAKLQSVQASPGILYVAHDGDCGSATPCYNTIQTAVDAAQPNDEIRVAAGLYPIQPGMNQVVLIEKSLTIRGGYTANDWNTPNPEDNMTTVNALSQGRVLVINGTVDVTVEGLQLIYGSSAGLGNGGGLYAEGALVSLRQTWVTTNTAPSPGKGGGIYVKDGNLVVESCTIQANTAGSGGGGMYILNSQATIEDCQIIANTANAGDGGGGVLVGGASQATMARNVIKDNETSFLVSGGGIALNESTQNYTGIMSLHLFNNLIEGGYSGQGGGLYVRRGYATNFHNLSVTATIISNTIRDNYTYYGGAGIAASASITITHNALVYNHAGVDKHTGIGNYGIGGALSVSGPAQIEANIIEDNEARGIGGTGQGGGADLSGNSPIIFCNNRVINNKASGVLGGRGGGLWVAGSNVIVDGNYIQHNLATGGTSTYQNGWGGGGIYASSNVTFTNNFITDNSVSSYVSRGSGMTIAGASPHLYHNTFVNNTGGSGMGLYIKDDSQPSQPILYNSIVASQTVGIYVDNTAPQNLATLYGVLWWGNEDNTSGTAFAFDETSGNPLFVDVDSADYHISLGSSAIDHGVSSSVYTDIDNEPRSGIPDLGADEYWEPGALKYGYLPLVVR
jgi:hypothetical protein